MSVYKIINYILSECAVYIYMCISSQLLMQKCVRVEGGGTMTDKEGDLLITCTLLNIWNFFTMCIYFLFKRRGWGNKEGQREWAMMHKDRGNPT